MCKKNRAKGSGTLELKGKIWRAKWMVDGKVYRRSTGETDKREAAKRLAEFVAPFRLGTEKETLEYLTAKVQGVNAELQAIEEAKPALSVADTFSAYRSCLSRPNRAGDEQMDRYESQFGELAEWLKREHPDVLELRHVTQDIAEEYATELAHKSRAGTFNKRITLYRSIWEHLHDTARLSNNPWKKIRKLEVINHVRRELTVEELERVIKSLSGEMRLLFAVGIYTGLRLGDCCRLSWANVDMVRSIITIIPHKTKSYAKGKPVIIPLHAVLAGMLAETPAKVRKGFIMQEIAAKFNRDPSAVSKKIQAIFEANGIETKAKDKSGKGRAQTDVGFHSLRHTFVSLSANAGVPLAIVQAIVGHSNPAMTRHYFHESEAALQSAVAALPALPVEATEKKKSERAPLPKAALSLLDELTHDELLALQAELAKRL